MISASYLYATNWERVREIDLFALVLVVQAVPFLASVLLATLEGSRANEFVAWRALGAKFGELASRRPAMPAMPAIPAIAEAPVAAEKQVETAQ